MRQRILFLDDEDERHLTVATKLAKHDLVAVHTYNEACDALQGERFDVVFLDHDLNDNPKYKSSVPGMYGSHEYTGVDVAVFMTTLEAAKMPTRVIVHSMNPPGAARIAAVLREHGFPVTTMPFGSITWNS